MRLLNLILLALLLVPGSAAPQPEPPPGTAPSVAASEAKGVVPVPEPTEKALQYYRSGNALWFVNVVWGLLVPVVFLFTGFSARMRDWARRIGRRWFFVIAVYIILFTVIQTVIDLPLAYYQQFVRQHAYGLSNQTFAKWFSDNAKGLMVGTIIGVLFLWVPYLLLAKSPRRWWLYTSLAFVPFLFFIMLVSPVFIDPLFNEFGPMKDKTLETQILALADKAGIEGGRVYEVNKSVDTKTVNAYVTGFGSTKRIVLWDTTMERLEPPQILTVMGHEMGHFVLGHVVKGVFFFSLVILATLYAAHRTADGLIARYKARFRFDSLADVASLPLILLLVNVFSLIVTPVALTFTRYQEHEADRFGLEVTQDNYAAATAFVKLQQENLGNPRPGLLYKLWRASHPLLGERIDFCNAYRPWENGEPLRYGHLFRSQSGH